MKKIILTALVFTVVFSTTAFCVSSTVLTWNRDFGIGIIAGDPTGLSFKIWQTKTTAIDGALGWWLGDYVNVHVDYLIHNLTLIKIKEGLMPVYFGIGAFAGAWGGGGDLGIRVPLGLSYLFQDSPLELFFEIAPSLNVIPGTSFGVGWGLGARYYFQ